MTAVERLAAIKERDRKATKGPWYWRNTSGVYLLGKASRAVMTFSRMGMSSAQPEFRSHEDGLLTKAGRANINDFPDATFIAAARSDVPALVAAVEKVLERHRPVTRWTHPDGDYSISQDDYDDSPADYTHLEPFVVCAECFRIEQSPEQHGGDEHCHEVLEGLYPCPTVCAVEEALG